MKTKPGRRPDEINTGLGEGERASVEISSRFVNPSAEQGCEGRSRNKEGNCREAVKRGSAAHFHRGTVYERFISGELADSVGCPRGCFAKPRRKIRRVVSSVAESTPLLRQPINRLPSFTGLLVSSLYVYIYINEAKPDVDKQRKRRSPQRVNKLGKLKTEILKTSRFSRNARVQRTNLSFNTSQRIFQRGQKKLHAL